MNSNEKEVLLVSNTQLNQIRNDEFQKGLVEGERRAMEKVKEVIKEHISASEFTDSAVTTLVHLSEDLGLTLIDDMLGLSEEVKK